MFSQQAETGSYSGLVNNKIITQDDGAKWRQFDIEGGVVILTSAGQEFVQDTNIKEVLRDLKQYRKEVEGEAIDSKESTRLEMANGGNGTVYALGDKDVAIKESNSSHSLYSAMYRMDHLSHIVETSMPHWISVAKHYGIITSNKLDKEYLFMEKIDNGITLEDIEGYVKHGKGRFPKMQQSIQTIFGEITTEDLEEIKAQRTEFIERMGTYADENGVRVESLIPDPNPANILVTPLRTPIGGKKFKLWVIDQ